MSADLIKDLEEAEEGSREISDKVLLACGWVKNTHTGVTVWTSPDGRHPMPLYVPCPAESVDHALALVPDGWRWGVRSVEKKYDAWLSRWSSEWIECEGTTPALALCAVILKAKGHK